MLSYRILKRLSSIPGVRGAWVRFPFGPVNLRVDFDIWARPHYAYGTYQAARQAAALGLKSISVIEFGVAGGRGLLALESIAEEVARDRGIAISVFGFDAGEGMPEPSGYKDLPHVWEKGFYRMDVAGLKSRLKSAQLILGPVGRTVPEFCASTQVPPIGFVAFDLDYYSSTKEAFAIFRIPSEGRLPRVYCYFDDTISPETACHNEYVGELCAIREFNDQPGQQKLCPIHLLRNTRLHPAKWNDEMYVLHDFEHPLYCVNLTPSGDYYRQKPL
jgi:hypothetical protein